MNTPYYDEDGNYVENEDYFDRSGCGPVVLAFLCIVVFWVVVGCIYLFT